MKEHTTGRGVTVGVIPIPLLLDEIRGAHPFPKRPTYTEELAGGAKQEIEITDREALVWQKQDPDTWAEHAETWADYERERDAVQELLNDRIWRAIMLKALVFDMPTDDEWVRDHEDMGLTVPANPRERRIHYIKTEVIAGMPDVWKLTAMANGADLSEGALQLAEDSFRSELARNLLKGLADQVRALDAGNAGSSDENGEKVGRET